MSFGLSEEDFWRRTPRQISHTFEAQSRRLRREHNERMHLAWHIAALPKMKKFPASPQKLMVAVDGKSSRKAPQSPEQMLAIVKMFVGLPKTQPKV